MHKMCWLKVSLPIVAMLAAGCASAPPTVGEIMRAQGESAQELSKRWNEGNSLLVEGGKLKQEGQEMVEEGSAKIEEGDEMISEGKRMMETSEKSFAEKFPNAKPLK